MNRVSPFFGLKSIIKKPNLSFSLTIIVTEFLEKVIWKDPYDIDFMESNDTDSNCSDDDKGKSNGFSRYCSRNGMTDDIYSGDCDDEISGFKNISLYDKLLQLKTSYLEEVEEVS